MLKLRPITNTDCCWDNYLCNCFSTILCKIETQSRRMKFKTIHVSAQSRSRYDSDNLSTRFESQPVSNSYYTVERTVLSYVSRLTQYQSRRRHEFKVMDSPPPAYDATSSMLSSEAIEVSALMTAAAQPPEYSACVFVPNRGVALVEHIPSCLETNQRVIPDPLDCNESSLFSPHPSITILPGSFNISTRATHPLSSRGAGPGCEESDFRICVPDTPPPPYETAMIILRPRPVEIISRDDTSDSDHVMCTVPSTERASPSIHHLPMSGNHRPIPHSTPVEQPERINFDDTTATQRQIDKPPCNFLIGILSFMGYVVLGLVTLCSLIGAINFLINFLLREEHVGILAYMNYVVLGSVILGSLIGAVIYLLRKVNAIPAT